MSDFSTAVQTRIPDQQLIQLTNHSGGTTIDTDVLTAACEDAQGTFRNETGVEPDSTNTTHVAIIVSGVRHFLESYKARSSSIMTQSGKSFFAALQSFSKKKTMLGATNSPILPVLRQRPRREKADMDRTNPAFTGSRAGVTNAVTEVSEYAD